MTLTAISAGASDALEEWLITIKALNATADNTISAYRSDLLGYLAFISNHFGDATGLAPLKKIKVTDMRAWMAHERSRGVSARSLARSLSAVKSFYRWLAERDGFDPTVVLSAQQPPFSTKTAAPADD